MLNATVASSAKKWQLLLWVRVSWGHFWRQRQQVNRFPTKRDLSGWMHLRQYTFLQTHSVWACSRQSPSLLHDSQNVNVANQPLGLATIVLFSFRNAAAGWRGFLSFGSSFVIRIFVLVLVAAAHHTTYQIKKQSRILMLQSSASTRADVPGAFSLPNIAHWLFLPELHMDSVMVRVFEDNFYHYLQ